MKTNEIKNLRKSGKLEEALAEAKKLMEVDSENIWNKRAIAWVYYDLLKKNNEINSFLEFKDYLEKIGSLGFPSDENLIFDQCAWQIGKMIFTLSHEEHIDLLRVSEIFNIIKSFHFTKPNDSYKFLLKSFLKVKENWDDFLKFANWWGFKNFGSEDYLKEEINGKKVVSIVERSYIAYAKKILERRNSFTNSLQEGQDHVKNFLLIMDQIIDSHPEFIYLPYYKGKLLISLGERENALKEFLPFAKKKKKEFWVWDVMAEIFQDDEEMVIACYCKALSLQTQGEFLIKIRKKLIDLLVKRSLFNEAKTEIFIIMDIYVKNNWKISTDIKDLLKQVWQIKAKANKNNDFFYSKYLKKAEKILFNDIPEEIIVVEFVNRNSKILNFIKNKNISGFFNYLSHIDKPKIGDILKVRFNNKNKGPFYQVLTLEVASESIESDALKSFKGTLEIVSDLHIGFVEKVFFSSKFIKSKSLVNGQEVEGKAVLSFNKKRGEWGWKAITVEIISSN